MPEVLGPQTIANFALPTGVDGAKVAQWTLREGITYEQFANQLALALADANREMADEIGPVASMTEEIMLEYADGGSITPLKEITDVSELEMVHGTTIGSMLPFRHYGGAVGGSWMFFRDTRMAQIRSTISTIVRQARWRFSQTWMTRFFTNTENAIGSAGYDVPFVRGTGGNVDYTPPAYAGEAFTSAHDHFVGVNSASKTHADLLNELAETVEEHGHTAPFRAVVAKADVASYAALAKFKQLVSPRTMIVDLGGRSTAPQFYAQGQPMVTGGVFGYFESDYGEIELVSTPRLATGYAGLWKSYGQMDARNPLAVRVHPDVGFGLYIVPERSGDDRFPVSKINVLLEVGVGVGDRTNGAAGYLVSGGTWANPTIS